MSPKCLWGHSRRVSEPHLRTQRERRPAEVTYGHDTEATYCPTEVDRAKECKKEPVWVYARFIPGRLLGKAMRTQQKEIESEWPEKAVTISQPERRWIQPDQENHRWATSIRWGGRRLNPWNQPRQSQLEAIPSPESTKFKSATLLAKKSCCDPFISSSSSTSKMALSHLQEEWKEQGNPPLSSPIVGF